MSETTRPKNSVFILSCSGPSNVGQLANHVAVELTQAGLGQMLNLAGIATHREAFVQAVRELVRNMVVIDGCAVRCTKGVLDHLQIQVDAHLVLTDFGIGKSDDLNFNREEVEKVKNVFKEMLPRLEAGLPAARPKCLCAEEW